VLRAAERVNPHLRRQFGVAPAERIGVDQRTGAVPIFRRRLGVHQLGRHARGAGPPQDAVAAAGERVLLVAIGEREKIGGVEVVVVLAVVPRGRGETVVEEAQAGACDVRHDAVEHLPPLFVGIEAVVEKHPQAAAALRGAEAVGVTRGRCAVVQKQRVGLAAVVLEARDQVANARQT